MHGIEIAGVEVIRRVTRELVDPKKLKGRVIAVPIQNPLAVRDHNMITPRDGLNMNRLFPGDKMDSITGRMAEVLFKEVTLKGDVVIDIHCNTPPAVCWVTLHAGDDAAGNRSREIAAAFGVTVIDAGPAAAWGNLGAGRGMMADIATHHEKPAFIVELEAFTFPEPMVKAGVRGILNVMRKLGMIEGALEAQTDVPVIKETLNKVKPLRATRGGFVHHLAEVGSTVKKGQDIAILRDPFGDIVETIQSPVDGYLVAYPRMLGNQSAATGDLVAMVAPPLGK
jgi:predicted deacylase